jgi:O-acetyl-ADP-ribose deacetylase (regulator of RNase III)
MITIVDLNPAVANAAAAQGFNSSCSNILTHQGVLVSPANSFGFMDGGIDAVYLRAYPDIQNRVQEQIFREWGGELPVGQAVAVKNHESTKHQWVICAPTMRTPATGLQGTLNPYLAMRAAVRLYEALQINFIIDIPLLCPGLGTLSGGMDPKIALAQMRAATKPPIRFQNWRQAKEYEEQLRDGSI